MSDTKKNPMWTMMAMMGVFYAVSMGIFGVWVTDRISESDEPKVVQEKEESLFFNISPFTVNVQSDSSRSRLLYSGTTIRVGNQQTHDFLAENMPIVKNRMISLISSSDAEDLVTAEGKQKLANSIITALSTQMLTGQPTLKIHEVLFTEFVVQ